MTHKKAEIRHASWIDPDDDEDGRHTVKCGCCKNEDKLDLMFDLEGPYGGVKKIEEDHLVFDVYCWNPGRTLDPDEAKMASMVFEFYPDIKAKWNTMSW